MFDLDSSLQANGLRSFTHCLCEVQWSILVRSTDVASWKKSGEAPGPGAEKTGAPYILSYNLQIPVVKIHVSPFLGCISLIIEHSSQALHALAPVSNTEHSKIS